MDTTGLHHGHGKKNCLRTKQMATYQQLKKLQFQQYGTILEYRRHGVSPNNAAGERKNQDFQDPVDY